MAYAGGGGEVVSPPAAARVHCSICGKLLPKLDGSKVYRCGDCNAALQAKGPPTTVSVKAATTSEKKSGKFLVGTPSVKKEKEPSSFGSSSGVASEKGGGGGSLCHGRSRESNGSNTSRSDSGEESRIGSSFTATKLNSDGMAKCKETQIGPGNGNPRYRRISKPMLYHPRLKQSVDIAEEEATREREDVGGAMDSPAMPPPQLFTPYKHPDQRPSEILTKLDVIRDQLNSRPFSKNPNPLTMTSSYHDQPYNNFRRHPYEQHLNPTPSGVPESSYHPIQHHHQQQPLQCSCQQCHNCHWQMHQPLPPTGFQGRTLPCVVPDSYMFSSMDLLQSGGNSQMMRFPKKSLSRNTYKRECRPFAHGAPFIMCYNCFELLQFPCDLLLNGKHLNRVECGSCSQVITFKLAGKRLVVESDDSRTGNEAAGNVSALQQVEEDEEESNEFRIDDSSNYEAMMYNGPSLHDILSIPASNIQKHASPPPSSNASKKGVEQCGESPPLSDRSKHFEEMVDDYNDNSAMSFSSNHSNLEASKNSSSYVSNEEDDEHKSTGESFIVKVFKTGLSRPKGKGKGKGKAKVFVNGHPIPDRLVKRAEKQAGSIQPGEYWYDYRAGFWGIMGQPCFGIIPSFIEEFNYPMSPKCAAGTTSILVNGRELHEQDLKLLADRGLPTTRGRSYIIEMSGEVTDAVSGEELDALGKLAPTIEKLKQGFGMRRPKVAAA